MILTQGSADKETLRINPSLYSEQPIQRDSKMNDTSADNLTRNPVANDKRSSNSVPIVKLFLESRVVSEQLDDSNYLGLWLLVKERL